MRVHERGSGETRSCGTGACAVMVAAALADGAGRGTSYRVDPTERLVMVFMIQLMPNSTDTAEKFSTLVYQALDESRPMGTR